MEDTTSRKLFRFTTLGLVMILLGCTSWDYQENIVTVDGVEVFPNKDGTGESLVSLKLGQKVMAGVPKDETVVFLPVRIEGEEDAGYVRRETLRSELGLSVHLVQIVLLRECSKRPLFAI